MIEMPRKQGDSGLPKIKKLTKKQIADARRAKPPKGRRVAKGGIVRWIMPPK